LCVTDNWPQNSIEYLSIIIDFSHVSKLSLKSDLDENSINNAAILMNDLMARIHNLQSLVISYPLSYFLYQHDMEWIYPLTSSKVKHLEIDLFKNNYKRVPLSQLHHLSSVTFKLILVNYDEFISYLKENKINYTLRKNDSSISLWLDQNQDELLRMKYDVKRVKLTHDYNTNSIYYEPFS